jgi:hypothetical protein
MGGDSKSGGSGSKSYNYFATFAAVVRAGPVDTANALLVDGKAIWEGPINRTDGGVGNPYTITPTEGWRLMDGGYIKLYWGDDSQTTPDSALVGHPPYRGFAYIVFHRFLCGRERTNLPNIEFVGTAKARPPSSIIATTGAEDDRANPWAIVADLLTNRHGLGLPAARLNAASFDAAHDYLAGDADLRFLTYAAPLMTTQEEARTFCDGILGSFGGGLRVNGSGEIEAVQPTLDPGDLSHYLQLTENDYAKAVEVDAQTWDDVPTGIVLRFLNKDRQWKQDVMIHDDPLALQLVGESRRTSVERNWITSAEQARRMCAEWAKRFCRPVLSGTIYVRTHKILVHPAGSAVAGDPVREGDRIRIDVDSTPGGSGSSQLVRIVEMRRGQTGGVTIRWQAEPTSPQVAFSPVYTVPETTTPVPTNITVATIIPLPAALSEGREPRVGVLALRPDDMVTGCDVEFDVEDGAGTFTAIGSQIGFAVPCRVNVDHAATASGDIQIELTDTRDEHLALVQPGPSGAQDDQLLLILYSATAGLVDVVGSDHVMEIMSIQESAAVSGDVYDFTVLRARFGTRSREWLEDATGWIIPRSSLIGHFHTTFRTRMSDSTEMTFRLRSFNRFSTYDGALSDFPAQFSAFGDRAPLIVGFGQTYTYDRIVAADGLWDINTSTTSVAFDPDGDVVQFRMEYREVGTYGWTEIIDTTFRPSRRLTFADIFTLAAFPTATVELPSGYISGSWDRVSYWVRATVWDSRGISRWRDVVVFCPDGTASPTPLGPPDSVTRDANGLVTITGAAGVTSIQYIIDEPGGEAIDGGSSSIPLATISASSGTVSVPGGVRLWVRQVKAGSPDEFGPWVDYDFEDPTFPSQP